MEIFQDSIPNFESELLQVIETSGQATIDSYFVTLWDDIEEMKKRLEFSNLSQKVQNFNVRILQKFEQKVESETDDYFKHEQRKLGHLARYEDNEMSLLNFQTRKVWRVNHNFYCINEIPQVIDIDYLPNYHEIISGFADAFFFVAFKYGKRWHQKAIVSKHVTIKPVLYVEGELDIRYIRLAGRHLQKESTLVQIDIRQRGGYKNLDTMWAVFKKDNWDTFIQKKLLLYDCDINKTDEDLGHIYKRIIPSVPVNPIKKGIENLFSYTVINRMITEQRKLVDTISSKKIERGVESESVEYMINHQEKTNFFNWVEANCIAADFKDFKVIFDYIEQLLLN